MSQYSDAEKRLKLALKDYTPDPNRRCWKGHLYPLGVLTGVAAFGEMLFTCHEHFDELMSLPIESDYSARRDN